MTKHVKVLEKIDFWINRETRYRAALKIALKLSEQKEIEPSQMPSVTETMHLMEKRIPFVINCDLIRFRYNPKTKELIKITNIPAV